MESFVNSFYNAVFIDRQNRIFWTRGIKSTMNTFRFYARNSVLIKFYQLNNQVTHVISWIMFSHLTFLELHLGHFLRSLISLSFISKAGVQPVQHDMDLPRFCMALPTFFSSSVLPKYQKLPQDWQVHLVSLSLLCSLGVWYFFQRFTCVSLIPRISLLNHVINPINFFII